MFENLRADFVQARKVNVGVGRWNQLVKVLLQPGTLAVVNYRFCRWVRTVRLPIVRHVFLIIAAVVRYLVELLTGVNISPRADIGPGFVVHTPYGIFIAPVKIGRNCVVQHGVAITYGVREIGDNVYFGPGAKAIGNVRIGNNVVVVANSLVLTDVPDNMTVVGVPARIRWRRGRTLRFDRSSNNGGISQPATAGTGRERGA